MDKVRVIESAIKTGNLGLFFESLSDDLNAYTVKEWRQTAATLLLITQFQSTQPGSIKERRAQQILEYFNNILYTLAPVKEL